LHFVVVVVVVVVKTDYESVAKEFSNYFKVYGLLQIEILIK